MVVDLAIEVGGISAVLTREREEPGPVELCLLDEAQQLVVVVLGLARIADDERRAERRLWFPAADVSDALEEAGAVAPATHPPQEPLGHMLEREVEVRDAGGTDRFDQPIGEL